MSCAIQLNAWLSDAQAADKAVKRKQRPPVHEYIRHLVYDRLASGEVTKVGLEGRTKSWMRFSAPSVWRVNSLDLTLSVPVYSSQGHCVLSAFYLGVGSSSRASIRSGYLAGLTPYATVHCTPLTNHRLALTLIDSSILRLKRNKSSFPQQPIVGDEEAEAAGVGAGGALLAGHASEGQPQRVSRTQHAQHAQHMKHTEVQVEEAPCSGTLPPACPLQAGVHVPAMARGRVSSLGDHTADLVPRASGRSWPG